MNEKLEIPRKVLMNNLRGESTLYLQAILFDILEELKKRGAFERGKGEEYFVLKLLDTIDSLNNLLPIIPTGELEYLLDELMEEAAKRSEESKTDSTLR